MKNAPTTNSNESAPNKRNYTPTTLAEQDRAASALRHLDPNCPHDDWVRIGMAANAAGLTFDDFHTWSKQAANYGGENECRAKWKSFDAAGGVTSATLLKAAFDQG